MKNSYLITLLVSGVVLIVLSAFLSTLSSIIFSELMIEATSSGMDVSLSLPVGPHIAVGAIGLVLVLFSVAIAIRSSNRSASDVGSNNDVQNA